MKAGDRAPKLSFGSGRFSGEGRNMKKRIALLLILTACVCLGMNCEGNAPAATPVRCFVTYFNNTVRGGFSPPSGFIGPTRISFDSGPDFLWLNWSLPGEDTNTFTFFSNITDRTTEEYGAHNAQVTGTYSTVVLNEQILLNSGQMGWIVADRSREFPNDLIGVSVSLVRNGRVYGVNARGTSRLGTDDFEYLIGVARTLCAE